MFNYLKLRTVLKYRYYYINFIAINCIFVSVYSNRTPICGL